MHWFLYVIASTFLIGTFVALFKIPAHKGYNALSVLLFSFLSSAICAIFLFHNAFSQTNIGVLVCALLWGVTFATGAAVQMRALRYIDVGVLSPITASVELAIVVLIGTFFFHDKISMLAWVGIALVVLTIAFLSEKREKKGTFFGPAFVFITTIVALGTFNTFLIKYEVSHFSIEAIQLYQYFFGFLMIALLVPFTEKSARNAFSIQEFRKAAPWGILLGLFSIFGGYLFYLALKSGPFAIVNSIGSLYIIVTVIVAAVLFKEKLTPKRILLVILALVAVMLMQV